MSLDTAFADIARGEDGRVRAVLRSPDGRRLELWAGPGFDYLQVFTTDRFPGHDLAIAVEPMTAPANAFNSGQSLRWLEPGETWEVAVGHRVASTYPGGVKENVTTRGVRPLS